MTSVPDTNEPTKIAQELGEKLKVPNVEFDAWVASMPAKHWSKYDLSACRLGWEAGRRVSSAPSFADGIEAAAKVAIELGTAPLEGANIRIGIGNAIAAAIRALAHNPQASSEYEKCATCNGTGLHLNMAGEPDECLDCKGNTVVPAERSDAVAELVEVIRDEATDVDGLRNLLLAAENVEAALTASNDRVAELERERDEALATMTRATEAMVECGNLLADEDLKREAAEAEVSRLKAGAVTDEMVEAALLAVEGQRAGRYSMRTALEAALANQAGASK